MTNDISQALGCIGCHFSVWLVCLGFVWMLKVTKFSWKMATWKPNEVRAKRSSEDRLSKWHFYYQHNTWSHLCLQHTSELSISSTLQISPTARTTVFWCCFWGLCLLIISDVIQFMSSEKNAYSVDLVS